jgi:hypothetical protein
MSEAPGPGRWPVAPTGALLADVRPAGALLVQQVLDSAQRAAQGLRICSGAVEREHGFELDSDGIRYGLQRFRCVSLHSAALHCARYAID